MFVQIIVWWFHINIAFHKECRDGGNKAKVKKPDNEKLHLHFWRQQFAPLCHELVDLWRLVALNPKLSHGERKALHVKISGWHAKVMDTVAQSINSSLTVASSRKKHNARSASRLLDENNIQIFTGFKSAIDACYHAAWDESSVAGVTPNHEQPCPPVAGNRGNQLQCPAESKVSVDQTLCCVPIEPQSKKRKMSPPEEYYVDDEVKRSEISIPPPESSTRKRGIERTQPKVTRSKSNDITVDLKSHDDQLEILFARAEGLHANGHLTEACELANQLANTLLAKPPNLMADVPPIIILNGKTKTDSACHQMSCLDSATLPKCTFLCSVLVEHVKYQHLAFRAGLFASELARRPALVPTVRVVETFEQVEPSESKYVSSMTNF